MEVKMTEIKTIKKLARTGGIIFEGEEEWYNPEGKVKDFLLKAKGMEGKEVEVTLSNEDPHKFTFLKVVGGGSPDKIEPSAIAGTNERQKIRSMALSYVKDITVASIAKGETFSVHSMEVMAEKFYEYIWSGKICEP
jgi:hypothetical protein